MNCKNCKDPLEKNALFCDNCGAKVITSRITFKLLVSELFINVFGIDSKFFLTLKHLLTKPQDVLNDYLIGVRKRYVNPFAYLAVGAALSLIIFNFFSEEYKEIQGSINKDQISEMKEIAEKDLSTVKNISAEELKKLQKKQNSAKFTINFLEKYVNFILQNFNLIAFLFLPYYSLLSKWTYRKPYNYGEHIVINAYLQGTTMYFSIIAFFLAMLIHPLFFSISILLYILYYLYAFAQLFKLSILKTIGKLFKFLIVFLITSIIFLIALALIIVIVIFIIKWLNPELIKGLFHN
jgi:hypothetical protein